MRLYLASRSPRRRELLTQIGVAFDTIVFRTDSRADAETDETPITGETAENYVERISKAKAKHGLRIIHERKLPLRPILAADTTLELDGEIIGKPADIADAVNILSKLSGKAHRVLTGVTVTLLDRTEYILSTSEVQFRELDIDEIRHYVMTGEPMDKAGAYAVQGRAGLFVKHISGSFSGIMGLPVCETGELLKSFGWRF